MRAHAYRYLISKNLRLFFRCADALFNPYLRHSAKILIAISLMGSSAFVVAENSRPNERINPFANPLFNPTISSTALTDYTNPSLTQEFRLKAIMYSSNLPLANIDGNILEIGDDHLGFQVIDIQPFAVTLRKLGVKDYSVLKLELRPELASNDRKAKPGENL